MVPSGVGNLAGRHHPTTLSHVSSLLKSNVAVATGTAVSRVTGVVRVAVLGAVLGTPSAVADAYDLANGTPNMIYELLIGGVLSSSLVPLFTRLRDEEDEEGQSAVLTVSIIVISLVTLVAVALAPLIFRLYSLLTSADVDADQYRAVGTALRRAGRLRPARCLYGAPRTAAHTASRIQAAPGSRRHGATPCRAGIARRRPSSPCSARGL